MKFILPKGELALRVPIQMIFHAIGKITWYGIIRNKFCETIFLYNAACVYVWMASKLASKAIILIDKEGRREGRFLGW